MAERTRAQRTAPAGPEVARADAVVAALQAQYPELVAPELERFVAHGTYICREIGGGAQACDGPSPADCKTLYRMAHDFKGHAGSYGYPLVSTIADSICRLIQDGALDTPAGRLSVACRVEAVQRLIRQRVAGDGGAEAAKILATLNVR